MYRSPWVLVRIETSAYKKAINLAGLEYFSSQITTSSTSSSFEPKITFFLASQGALAGTIISSILDFDPIPQLSFRERRFELDLDLANRDNDSFWHDLINFFSFFAFGFWGESSISVSMSTFELVLFLRRNRREQSFFVTGNSKLLAIARLEGLERVKICSVKVLFIFLFYFFLLDCKRRLLYTRKRR